MLKIVRLLLPLCLQLRKSSLIPSCSDSIVFFYTSQWFHWILLFCAGTGLLGFKTHNIFMSSVFQTFNWAFLVSFNSIVSIICWANYLLLNMRCWQPRRDRRLYFQCSISMYLYMSNSYLSSCFHVCSCMVVILNWSSVTSMTGWKSFHYTKERPMLKITRRMRKRGWWENTRYHRLGDILPKCLLRNRNYWNSYFPPSGFLLGVSHWSRRGWRHPLSDNQRDPTKFCNQSVGPSVYYQGLLIIGVICLLLILLLLSKISPNVWDFYCLFDLQATNLAPQDLNGKSDPYLLVRIGQQTLDTKDRYIPKQLNPTFGESVLYPPPPAFIPCTLTGRVFDSQHALHFLSGCLNSQCPSRWKQNCSSEFWTMISWGQMMWSVKRGLTSRIASTAATEPLVVWLCTTTRECLTRILLVSISRHHTVSLKA